MSKFHVISVGAFALFAMSAPALVHAENLSDRISVLLEDHDRVAAARFELEAAQEDYSASWGVWTPDLLVTGSAGLENQNKPNAADTDLEPKEITVTITQPIYDFGGQSAAREVARLGVERAAVRMEQAENSLVFDAAQAYLNLVRANIFLTYAEESVENVKQQTELETELVELGRGYSTDVLQAKTQFSGATSRRIVAQGLVTQAINQYRSVYRSEPDLDALVPVGDFDPAVVPSSLEEALEIGMNNNPQLRLAKLNAAVAQEAERNTISDEFAPEINAVLEASHSNDRDGVAGDRQETIAKLEFVWPFDLGLTGINTLRSDRATAAAATRRVQEAGSAVEERIRNAWASMLTAQSNVVALENQAALAQQFLDLALEERTAGRRSLLEVLSAETVLTNTLSDAEAARTDVSISVLRLLRAMNTLSISNLPPNASS